MSEERAGGRMPRLAYEKPEVRVMKLNDVLDELTGRADSIMDELRRRVRDLSEEATLLGDRVVALVVEAEACEDKLEDLKVLQAKISAVRDALEEREAKERA